MTRAGPGPYQRLLRQITGSHEADVPLEQISLPLRLGTVFDGVFEEMTFLRAGALVWPTMNEVPEARYGRVVAAQLASLALRGQLWFHYGGEYVGPPGLMATRHPDAAGPHQREEQLLMTVVFGGAQSVRLASRTNGRQWDRLSALTNELLKEADLGWKRLDRYRTLRLLKGLRRWMREYAAPEPEWDANRPLHSAGYPFAVLFGIENGPGSWPHPPEEDVFLPSLLPLACNLAINNVPTGHGI